MFVFINVLIRFFDVILIVKQLKGCIYSETEEGTVLEKNTTTEEYLQA